MALLQGNVRWQTAQAHAEKVVEVCRIKIEFGFRNWVPGFFFKGVLGLKSRDPWKTLSFHFSCRQYVDDVARGIFLQILFSCISRRVQGGSSFLGPA